MTMQVIGVGVGRTGTYSLKLAINQLGLGPCHHMEEVFHHQSEQVPLWTAATNGHPDWEAIYQGYESAVDWPTAGFFRELGSVYPSAKFVLTVRSPERWVESFSETIYKLLAGRDQAPKEMQAWLEMAAAIIDNSGFPHGLDSTALMTAFAAHNDAVRAAIPANQLLVFEVKDGWAPLCCLSRFAGARGPVSPAPTPAASFGIVCLIKTKLISGCRNQLA